MKKLVKGIMKFITNKKGTIFVTVIVLATLMVLIGTGLSNMIMQDTHLIKNMRYSTQALLIAESGINDALATLVSLGFNAVNNGGNFPQKAYGGGTYDVDVIQSGGRVLLRSVGTISGISRTVSCEIRNTTPTAMYYMMSAGSTLRLRSFFLSSVDVNGDLHANDDVRLRAQALAVIDIDPCADPSGCCDGSVSAGDKIFKTIGFWAAIYISGSETENAPLVTFPNFDYVYYQQQAQAGSSYYAGDQTFGSVGTTTNLNPSTGIVYVEGTATLQGTVNVYGGIVADRIRVIGRLNQHKSGTKNVIISRTNDIEVMYRLDAEEAIVFAGRDFQVISAGSTVSVTGILLGGRDISIWDVLTNITYNHLVLYPDGLLISGAGGFALEVLNWTR